LSSTSRPASTGHTRVSSPGIGAHDTPPYVAGVKKDGTMPSPRLAAATVERNSCLLRDVYSAKRCKAFRKIILLPSSWRKAQSTRQVAGPGKSAQYVAYPGVTLPPTLHV
jgi:hypothetical protein